MVVGYVHIYLQKLNLDQIDFMTNGTKQKLDMSKRNPHVDSEMFTLHAQTFDFSSTTLATAT